MSDRSNNAEVLVIWVAKHRFQWRVQDGNLLIDKGEEASVAQARKSGQAALMAARSFV